MLYLIFYNELFDCITEKSAFQITVGIPTKRNERPIAFNIKPQGYYRKSIGISFLSVGISTESWKADFFLEYHYAGLRFFSKMVIIFCFDFTLYIDHFVLNSLMIFITYNLSCLK